MLRFTVEAKAPIRMAPSDRFVVYSIEGEAANQRLLLRNSDGGSLEVTGARTETVFLHTIIEPVEERESRNGVEAVPGDVWVELEVTADAPVGVHHGSLELNTNHPMAPSLKIPYLARVRKLVSVRPDGARLWIAGSGDFDGASTFLALEHNRGSQFKITGISVSDPKIFTAEAVSGQTGGPRQTLRVKLKQGLVPESIPGTLQGWITISTDVPEAAELQVPVLVAPTRAGVRRPFQETQ
jgi:hypothetical protein